MQSNLIMIIFLSFVYIYLFVVVLGFWTFEFQIRCSKCITYIICRHTLFVFHVWDTIGLYISSEVHSTMVDYRYWKKMRTCHCLNADARRVSCMPPFTSGWSGENYFGETMYETRWNLITLTAHKVLQLFRRDSSVLFFLIGVDWLLIIVHYCLSHEHLSNDSQC